MTHAKQTFRTHAEQSIMTHAEQSIMTHAEQFDHDPCRTIWSFLAAFV